MFGSSHQEKSASLPSRMTPPYTQRHLLDDSVLEETPSTSSEGSLGGLGMYTHYTSVLILFLLILQTLFLSCVCILMYASCVLGEPGEEVGSDVEWTNRLRQGVEDMPSDFYKAQYVCEGCLKRKPILKNGKKPTMTSWSRYWVALWNTSLLYFPARSIRGTSRDSVRTYLVTLIQSNTNKCIPQLLLNCEFYFEQFRTDPSKMCSIVGWMVVMGDDQFHPDGFTITDPGTGKFLLNIHMRFLYFETETERLYWNICNIKLSFLQVMHTSSEQEPRRKLSSGVGFSTKPPKLIEKKLPIT